MLKAILFDLDGTLLDRETSLNRFVRNQYNRFCNSLSHVSQDHYCKRFIELDSRGMVWKDLVYQQLISELKITSLSWEVLLDDYVKQFREHCVIFQDVCTSLAFLKNQGYLLGLITNGRYPFQMDAINSLALSPYFSTILISEKEGIKKPDPAIFNKATRQLGVENRTAVYVGDHPATDIEGAKNAGLKTIWKRSPYWDGCPHADATFETFKELVPIIEILSGTC